jgi:ribbon-helix-helix protein
MQRTNVYLDDRQLALLRRLGDQRSVPVAQLVREAVDAWLEAQGVRQIDEEEWNRRFSDLLDRRRAIEERLRPDPAQVEEETNAAIAEVRRVAAARRR